MAAGDVEVRVARIFNTFGPRMHPNDGRVVSNFIIQVCLSPASPLGLQSSRVEQFGVTEGCVVRAA
jgi:hypothetical protein